MAQLHQLINKLQNYSNYKTPKLTPIDPTTDSNLNMDLIQLLGLDYAGNFQLKMAPGKLKLGYKLTALKELPCKTTDDVPTVFKTWLKTTITKTLETLEGQLRGTISKLRET